MGGHLVHASLPHLHNHCAPDNASRSSRCTRMCPNVVVVEKNQEMKLEAPPSVPLLQNKIGGL
eukprot:9391161-Ditylum_brightwellii.AAC.1